MNKKLICDNLARTDYVGALGCDELQFFNLLLQRLIERDYDSFNQVARAENLDLKPVYDMLEEKTLRKLQGNAILRGYELSLLLDMFSGRGQGSGVEAADKDAMQIDDEKLRKIFFELTGLRFGDQQSEKVKYYINLWSLRNIQIYLFDKGLRVYFNQRYAELSGVKDPDMNFSEITAKFPLSEIMEQDKLIEDFVFDEVGGSYQDGLKEDLIKEKASRDRANKLFEELCGMLNEPVMDYYIILEQMKKLHMDRRIKLIERAGAAFLRKHLKQSAVGGAQAVARRYNFSLPEVPENADPDEALREINNAFLVQCRNTENGRHFLRWEAILDHGLIIEDARGYTLPGGYTMIMVSPIEKQEHFLFAHCPLAQDRNMMIASFLREYLEQEKIAVAANTVINRTLERASGQIRLRNATRIAIYSFPVVVAVAALVGWVYNLTVGGLGAGIAVAAALTFIGEAIAARNGYSLEVKPEDSETVPEYACRDQGVLKLRTPSASGKDAKKKRKRPAK